MKKIFTFLMIVSVMGGVLAGCSGGDKAAEGGDAAKPAAEGEAAK